MTDAAKGFNCETCDKWHVFGIYVMAHWSDVLTHTCDCGAKHTICAGRVRQFKPGKKPQ